MIIAEQFNLPYVSTASVLEEARQSRSQARGDRRERALALEKWLQRVELGALQEFESLPIELEKCCRMRLQ